MNQIVSIPSSISLNDTEALDILSLHSTDYCSRTSDSIDFRVAPQSGRVVDLPAPDLIPDPDDSGDH